MFAHRFLRSVSKSRGPVRTTDAPGSSKALTVAITLAMVIMPLSAVVSFSDPAAAVDGDTSPAFGTDGTARFDTYQPGANMGNNAGEPGIGVNWNTGNVFINDFARMLRVDFDDTQFPPTASWVDKSSPFSRTNNDPILFTEPVTGTTWYGGLNGACSILSRTTDDGESFLPIGNGCALPGWDHPTIGAGPWAEPAPVEALSDLAVYYCAQPGTTQAYCARSLDGGTTFEPTTPPWIGTCTGLHGRLRVAPDGTAFIPDKRCNGRTGFAVTTDNGDSWNIRTVPGSQGSGRFDPSIAASFNPDDEGNHWAYFGQGEATGAFVAVTKDRGLTYEDVGTGNGAVPGTKWFDVGQLADPPIRHAEFAQMVAGDHDRAAFAFLGSTGTDVNTGTCDNASDHVWHMYVAMTYDGGTTWELQQVSDDPVQRGRIGGFGLQVPCRNLLDFNDITVDEEGRVLVGYADGCLDCLTVSSSRSEKATITRQTTGLGLFSTFDNDKVQITGPVTGEVGAPVTLTAAVDVPEPYDAHVAWGDASSDTFTGLTGTPFTATHAYAAEGQYDITLTVTDANGQDYVDVGQASIGENGGGVVQITSPEDGANVGRQVTVEGIVEQGENAAPTASFTHSVSGLDVSFDASASSDPDGDPISFTWDFGDGSAPGSGATVGHSYAASGTYEACLTVSDGTLIDELCKDVTVDNDSGRTTLATDPEGDAGGLTGNIDEMDITKLEAESNPDGSFTFIMTLATMPDDPQPPIEEGGVGGNWRVEWEGPGGRIDFVQLNAALTTDVCGSGSVDDAGIYRQDGNAQCTVEGGTPGKLFLTYPLEAMAAKGYTGSETLFAVTGTTAVYRGVPQDAPISAGATSGVDSTAENDYPLASSNPDLPKLGRTVGHGAKDAPSQPPADPHIVDTGGDVMGDTIPVTWADIESGWFDADSENLYVGLKVTDIPADQNSTAFVFYSVGFMPAYEVDDLTWGGLMAPEDTFTGLRTFALFSPLAFNGLTQPTTTNAPLLELQITFNDASDNGLSKFAVVAQLEDSTIDPDTDIIWWTVPRSILQDPEAGDPLTETTAVTAPAIGGLVTFGGAASDSAGPGNNFFFPAGPVDEPPVVELVADPVSGPPPLDVSFTGSTDAANIASWEIDYGDGDGETGSGSLPSSFSHIYENAGVFTAQLTVTDADTGLSGTGSAQVTAAASGTSVLVSAPGVGPVPATCNENCATWSAPLDLGSLEDGPLTLTAELFQDGELQSTDTVDVVLSAEDAAGIVIDAPLDQQRVPPGDVRVQGRLGVTDARPAASLAADPTQGVAPLTVDLELDGSDDDGIVSWRLTTGDGTVFDGTTLPATRSHTYETPGEYTARLQVTDTAGQTDAIAIAINVKDVNTPPDAPSNPSPADGATGIALPVTLAWTGSDPDGDALTFDVYLDTTDASTLVGADQGSNFIPIGLADDTTYFWRVVAKDGTDETSGPVWSFTTEGGDDESSKPHVVVAYIDTGGNPYHEQFRRPGLTQDPATYIDGYPTNAHQIDLCFYDAATDTVDDADCPSSVPAAAAQDADEWSELSVSSLGAFGPGQGELAWFPGTNIVGAISFAHSPSQLPVTVDGGAGSLDSHGTWVAGTIAGSTTGSCPECLIVTIEVDSVDAITAGYRWAARQPWIDVITSSVGVQILGTSTNPLDLFDAKTSAIRTAAENGKLSFEASGNGVLNFGLAPTVTPLGSAYNPWSIAVGCSRVVEGENCQWHDAPVPIIAMGEGRRTAAPNQFFGTPAVGGTSFSAPSAAGVAGRALLAVRTAMDDVHEGPDPTTLSLVNPGPNAATIPQDTALSNDVLTRLEFEEVLFKTARREIVDTSPNALSEPDSPASMVRGGYGDVYRGAWGIDHQLAEETWSSDSEIATVLLGLSDMPNRWVEETWWEQVVHASQEFWFGEEVPEPASDGADAWPRDDDVDPTNPGGHETPTSSSTTQATGLTQIEASATPPPGVPPSVDVNRLYLHHNNLGPDPADPVNNLIEYYMNTVPDPTGGTNCNGEGCTDDSGFGGTGIGTAGGRNAYLAKYPTLGGTVLLDSSEDITVHIDATGFAGAPPSPTEITVELTSSGALVAIGTAAKTVAVPDEGLYEATLTPLVDTITDPLELVVSWEGPVYSFHVESQGASWIELPIKGELPPIDFEPLTYFLDNFDATYNTNGDTVTLTRELGKLAGDADAGFTFPVPQLGGARINLVSEDLLATEASLLSGAGTANVWVCTFPVSDAGAALVTAKVTLSSGGTPLGGGSITTTLLGLHDGFSSPLRVPLTMHPALLPLSAPLEGTITVTGPEDVLTPNVGFCGGSDAKPWSVTFDVGQLGEQLPTADITSDPTEPLAGTVTVDGTYDAPPEVAVDDVVWFAKDMDSSWTSSTGSVMTLETDGPGEDSGGPIFLPNPNGMDLTFVSARPVAQDAPDGLSDAGVGEVLFWLTSLGPAADVTVDYTVLLEGTAGGQRLVAQGSRTTHVPDSLGAVDTIVNMPVRFSFTPQVTDPQPDERLVLLVDLHQPGGPTTGQVTCWCGHAERPVTVSLPTAAPQVATNEVVDLAIGTPVTLTPTVPVAADGTWSYELDTTLLADGDHDIIATPKATYGTDERAGLPVDVGVTVDNGDTNTAPTATLGLDPISGVVPLDVTATLGGSDAETVAASLSWSVDWGDGSPPDAGTGLPTTASHTYTAPGTFVAELTVTDGGGLSATASEPVAVLDTPPVERVVVIVDGGEPIEVVDDAGPGEEPFTSWHVDLGLTEPGLYGITARHEKGETVFSEDAVLVRIAESGVPEVIIQRPSDGADVTSEDIIEGIVDRYTGEEDPQTGTSPTAFTMDDGFQGLAPSFWTAMDAAAPAPDLPEAVTASDLRSALVHLASLSGVDAASVDAALAAKTLPDGAEAPLASLVEAVAQATELRRAAVEGIDPFELAAAHEDPVMLANVHVDHAKLQTAALTILSTIDANLAALQAVPTEPRVSAEPLIDLPGVFAFDEGTDTEYDGDFYFLKIDLAGDDAHFDTAGGAVGISAATDVSVTLDLDGNDLYQRTLDKDPSEFDGFDIQAAQGASANLGIGILVDAAGDDTYTADGDIDEGTLGTIERAVQGAAIVGGAAVLADLGGADTYTAAFTGQPNAETISVAAQGANSGFLLLDGSYVLLLETGGDDVYTASAETAFTAQGDATPTGAGQAALADLDGNDRYSREGLLNFQQASVQPGNAATGQFLDMDATDPSVAWMAPSEGDQLSDTANLLTRARDLDDMLGIFGARWVTSVSVSIDGGPEASMTQMGDSDTWELPLDTTGLADGTHTLTAIATNVDGFQTTATIEVDVLNNAPPVLDVVPTLTTEAPGVPPRIDLDLSGTTDPDGDALTFTVDWGDGGAPETTTDTSVGHDYTAGVYDVAVSVEDTAGNADAQTLSGVDLAAPTFLAATAESVGTDAATLTATTDEDASLAASVAPTGTVTVSGGPTAFTVDITELLPGVSYEATLTATDGTGNAAETVVPFTTSGVDNEPPVVTLDVPATVDTGTPVTATITATDPDDGPLASALISWGDGSPTETVALDANGEGTATHTYAARGPYTLTASATDADSATGSDTAELLVDTAPEVTLELPASPAPELVKQHILVTATDADGDALDVTLTIDGQAVTLTETDATDTDTSDGKGYEANVNLGPGPHDVAAEADDGDLQGTATGAFTVNHAPVLGGTVTPWSGTTGTEFTYVGSVSDDDGDTVTLELRIDADPAIVLGTTTGGDLEHVRTLPKGQHRFAFTATDGIDTVTWPGTQAFAFGPIVGDVDRVELALDADFTEPAVATTSDAFDTWSLALSALGLPEDETTTVYARAIDTDFGEGPTHQVTVNLDDLPTPSITVTTPLPVKTGETVDLQGSGEASHHGDPVDTFSWTLGDGATSTEQNPSHAYADDGTYVVELTVSDTAGRSASTSVDVLVLNRVPTVALDVSPDVLTPVDEATIDLDADDADGTVVSNTITVHDGPTTDDPVLASGSDSVSVTFPDDGDYLVVGTATDDDGATGEATTTVTVNNHRPSAELDVTPTALHVDDEILADASASEDPDGEIVSYTFELGDGTTVTQADPQLRHSYDEIGTFEVTVTVEDDDGSEIKSDAVLVDVFAGDITIKDRIGAYTTVSAALAAAGPGDTILVGPGTYPDAPEVTVPDITICQANAEQTDCGSDPADVVIRSDSGTGILVAADGVTLEGFTLLVSGEAADGATYGIDVPTGTLVSDLTVQNTIIRPDVEAGQLTGENAIRGRLASAELVDNELSGWATAVFLRPYGLDNRVADSTISQVGTGVSTWAPGTLIEGNTFSQVLLQAVDIAMVTDDPTTSADGNVLRHNDMTAAATGVQVRDLVSDTLVDARLNKWGVYDHDLIPARINDEGTGNTVQFLPFTDVDDLPEPPLVQRWTDGATEPDAFLSIQEAIDDPATTAGTRIQVPTGTLVDVDGGGTVGGQLEKHARTPWFEAVVLDEPGVTLCGQQLSRHAPCSVTGPRLAALEATDGTAPAITMTADDVTVQGMDVSGSSPLLDATGVAGLVVAGNGFTSTPSATEATHAIRIVDATAPSVTDNAVTGNLYPGSVAIRVEASNAAVVAGNDVQRAGTAIYLPASTGAVVDDNSILVPPRTQFGGESLGISVFEGSGHALAGNAIVGTGTGLTVSGTQDVTSRNDTFRGGSVGIAVKATGSAGEAGQPTGLSVNYADLRTPGTALSLGSDTMMLSVDAVCNDWGAYHDATIGSTRIDDRGTLNEVDYTPWISADSSQEEIIGCLTPPNAAFTADPNPALRGTEVQFTDHSTEGSRPIVSWAWDFGDGTTSDEQHPTHAYDRVRTYVVTLRVTDSDGIASTAVEQVHVRNGPPRLGPQGDRSVTHDETLSFTLSATDADEDDTLSFGMTNGPPGAVFTDNGDRTATFTWATTTSDIGTYPGVTFTVTDGIDVDASSITISVTDGAPTLSVPSTITAVTLQDIAFDAVATDPEGDPITLSAAGLPLGASFVDHGDGTGAFAWTPTVDQAGAYTVLVTAQALAHTTSRSVAISVGEHTTPPLVDAPAIHQALQGSTVTLTATATDAEGDAFTWNVESTPHAFGSFWTTNPDGSVTWTWNMPSSQTMPTTVRFTADEGDGVVGIAETVVEVLRRPRASFDGTATECFGTTATVPAVVAGVPTLLEATAFDPDGEIVTATFLPEGPGGPELPGMRRAGVFFTAEHTYAGPGPVTAEFTIEDNDGLTRTVQLPIEVVDNQAPVVDAGPDQIANASGPMGALLSVTATATDPEGCPLLDDAFDWTVPASLAHLWLAGVGDEVWVPVGEHPVQLSVTDPFGGVGTDTFTATVDDSISLGFALAHATGDPSGMMVVDPVASTADGRMHGNVTVLDDLARGVEGAQVAMVVTYYGTDTNTVLPLTVAELRGETDAVGRYEFEYDHDVAGLAATDGLSVASLPGLHTVEVFVQTPSRDGAPVDDIEGAELVAHYWVRPDAS